MQSKSFWLYFSAFMFMIMGLYFIINPSYEKSLEAKYYYTISDYKMAEKLSVEAFNLDSYNKMAATIMAQSQVAVRYVNYIEDAKKYIDIISKMAESEELTIPERAKIKMMSSIMIDSYKKITRTVLTDDKLVEDAAYYYEQFVKLNETVTNSK